MPHMCVCVCDTYHFNRIIKSITTSVIILEFYQYLVHLNFNDLNKISELFPNEIRLSEYQSVQKTEQRRDC